MWVTLTALAAGACSAAVTWWDNRRRRAAKPGELQQERGALAVLQDAMGAAQGNGLHPATTASAAAVGGNGTERGPLDDDSVGRGRWRLQLPRPLAAALAAGALVAVATALANGRRRREPTRSRVDDSTPRIPLREVVRFRESQWFLEELENSREGDPNAMLRLAKMYLYGQGCQRSVNLAQEWLRRARAGGVYCTLDELLTAEDMERITTKHQLNPALSPSGLGQQGRAGLAGVHTHGFSTTAAA